MKSQITIFRIQELGDIVTEWSCPAPPERPLSQLAADNKVLM
jgi:hypothetical protein